MDGLAPRPPTKNAIASNRYINDAHATGEPLGKIGEPNGADSSNYQTISPQMTVTSVFDLENLRINNHSIRTRYVMSERKMKSRTCRTGTKKDLLDHLKLLEYNRIGLRRSNRTRGDMEYDEVLSLTGCLGPVEDEIQPQGRTKINRDGRVEIGEGFHYIDGLGESSERKWFATEAECTEHAKGLKHGYIPRQGLVLRAGTIAGFKVEILAEHYLALLDQLNLFVLIADMGTEKREKLLFNIYSGILRKSSQWDNEKAPSYTIKNGQYIVSNVKKFFRNFVCSSLGRTLTRLVNYEKPKSIKPQSGEGTIPQATMGFIASGVESFMKMLGAASDTVMSFGWIRDAFRKKLEGWYDSIVGFIATTGTKAVLKILFRVVICTALVIAGHKLFMSLEKIHSILKVICSTLWGCTYNEMTEAEEDTEKIGVIEPQGFSEHLVTVALIVSSCAGTGVNLPALSTAFGLANASKGFTSFIMDNVRSLFGMVMYQVTKQEKYIWYSLAQKIVSLASDVEGWCKLNSNWKFSLQNNKIMADQVREFETRQTKLRTELAQQTTPVPNLHASMNQLDLVLKPMIKFMKYNDPKLSKRFEPMTIFCFGEVGQGKSTIQPLLVKAIYGELKKKGFLYMGNPLPAFDENQIWTRSVNSQFWDGYFNQFCYVMNEFCATSDTKLRSEGAAEFNTVVEATKMPVNMSEAPEKGTQFFTSPLICVTTNFEDFGNMGMTKPDSVLRRIFYPIKVTQKKFIDLEKPLTTAEIESAWLLEAVATTTAGKHKFFKSKIAPGVTSFRNLVHMVVESIIASSKKLNVVDNYAGLSSSSSSDDGNDDLPPGDPPKMPEVPPPGGPPAMPDGIPPPLGATLTDDMGAQDVMRALAERAKHAAELRALGKEKEKEPFNPQVEPDTSSFKLMVNLEQFKHSYLKCDYGRSWSTERVTLENLNNVPWYFKIKGIVPPKCHLTPISHKRWSTMYKLGYDPNDLDRVMEGVLIEVEGFHYMPWCRISEEYFRVYYTHSRWSRATPMERFDLRMRVLEQTIAEMTGNSADFLGLCVWNSEDLEIQPQIAGLILVGLIGLPACFYGGMKSKPLFEWATEKFYEKYQAWVSDERGNALFARLATKTYTTDTVWDLTEFADLTFVTCTWKDYDLVSLSLDWLIGVVKKEKIMTPALMCLLMKTLEMVKVKYRPNYTLISNVDARFDCLFKMAESTDQMAVVLELMRDDGIPLKSLNDYTTVTYVRMKSTDPSWFQKLTSTKRKGINESAWVGLGATVASLAVTVGLFALLGSAMIALVNYYEEIEPESYQKDVNVRMRKKPEVRRNHKGAEIKPQGYESYTNEMISVAPFMRLVSLMSDTENIQTWALVSGYSVFVNMHIFAQLGSVNRVSFRDLDGGKDCMTVPVASITRLENRDGYRIDCRPEAMNAYPCVRKWCVSSSKPFKGVGSVRLSYTVRRTNQGMAPLLTCTSSDVTNYDEKERKVGAIKAVKAFHIKQCYIAFGCPNQTGDCGKIQMALVPGKKRIMGIHQGGIGQDSFICPIFEEDVPFVGDPLIPSALGKEIQSQYGVTTFPKLEAPGYLENPVFVPSKTCFVESPIFSQMWEDNKVEVAPANLTFFENSDGELVDPRTKAFEKIGNDCDVQDWSILDDMLEHPEAYYQGFGEPRTTPRMLTLEETLNGIDGKIDGLDRSTSPTFDFHGEKKKDLWSEKGQPFWVDPRIEADLAEMKQAIAEDRDVKNTAFGCFKDELRDHARVNAGKTRLFAVNSLMVCVFIKMHIGMLFCELKTHLIDVSSSVGINPYGPEWARLYDYIMDLDGDIMNGDFEGWDVSIKFVMTYLLFKYCNSHYKYKENSWQWKELRMACRLTVGFLIIYGKRVFELRFSVCSGGWATSIMNTFCNHCFHTALWLWLIQPRLPEFGKGGYTTSMSDHMRMTYYGDDSGGRLSREASQFCNMGIAADFFKKYFGLRYTSPNKTDAKTWDGGDITQFQFLARKFVPTSLDGLDTVLAPLELSSIYGMLAYIRKPKQEGMTVETQFQQNLRTAQMEMFMHGEDKYESFMMEIRRWTQYMPMKPNYEEYSYWKKLYIRGYSVASGGSPVLKNAFVGFDGILLDEGGDPADNL